MSHYDTSVPKLIAENPKALKYRRRILSARKLEPTQKVRTLRVAGRLAGVGAIFYMVLAADWGDGEHCFSGVRRYFEEKKREFFTLSDEDAQELRSKGVLPSTIQSFNQSTPISIPQSSSNIGPFVGKTG